MEGVSTRRVDDLIKALGCDGISSSQVSRICEQLDEVVDSFLGRPLDGGPYPYVWLDGLRSLTARGLSGVELVTSDAHQGLKNAIAAVFAGASWQRCRTHCMANLLTRVPKRALLSLSKGWRGHPGPSRMVRTIYQQLSPAEVHGQLGRVVEQLREAFAEVAELLADATPDILAFTAFPVAHWQKLWSNNPQERLNREIRRRTNVVGLAPWSRDSGKKRGHRAIRGGRGLVRRALYMCAWAVIRHDSEMRRFYDRLRQRGKPGNVAVVAVMRKILLQINAVARRGTPWVPQEA